MTTDDGWRPGAPGFPERREMMSEPTNPMQEVLDFLESIEGAGYGGMASFEIARAHVRGMLNPAARAKEPVAFINKRLEDLAEANALYGKDQRFGAPDKIARNDREISWLKDLRSMIASPALGSFDKNDELVKALKDIFEVGDGWGPHSAAKPAGTTGEGHAKCREIAREALNRLSFPRPDRCTPADRTPQKVCLYSDGCPPDGPVCHLCAHVQPGDSK